MTKYCMGCMEQYEEGLEVCPHCGYVEGTQPEQALHMEPGSILHERFIVGRALGYGGFGVTYIGWDALLEQKVAIKEYLPSEFSTRMPGVTQVTVYNGDRSEQFHDGLARFVDEAKKLAKVNNVDGIVRIYDSFEENNTAYIVMEYLEGETLAQRLERDKTIDPDEAIAMLTPVIESLQIVHEHGIIHRDIAPDNLFITKDGSIKVIDFGAARFATTSHSRSLTVIIKPGYSPEEQYRSKSVQGGYTDVYAIGATLYRMITGVTPPDALERYAMAEDKGKDILVPISKYYKKIDENQENAILNAMNIRIEDRTPTMAAFLGELNSEDPVKRIYGKIQRNWAPEAWPLWAKITLPVAAVFVLVFGILFGTGVIGFESNLETQITIPEGMTRVPSVVNNTTETAETRLTEAVLLYTVAGKEYSSLVPADYVLEQDMTGGIIVQQNSILNVVISGGAETTAVPQVMNLPVAEAVALLEEAGFVVSQIEEFSIAIEEGSVISQDVPADEEMAIGSVITLVVSKGVDPEAEIEEKEIEIPNLVGKTYDEVLAIAESNGFKIAITEHKYSTEYEVNEVMSQDPGAGNAIMTGDTVSVVISMGKQMVRVPDVQYKNKETARAALEKLGLKVTITEVESDTVSAGLVMQQNPAANTSVDPGTTVKLTVSKGAASFAMPDVVGMTETKAKNTLAGKGLSVSVTYEYSSKAAGTVLRQSVSANTQVTRGTAVTITVSSGAETVKVANVVGQTSTNAQSALKSSGFAVTVNKVYNDTVAEGVVISQNPTGGSSQVKGSTVILTVSLGKDTVKGITVATKPTKTSYFVGETLNPAGLTLTANYKSGKTQTVTGGFSCSPTALNTVGTQTITVTYEGKTASFTVNVGDIVVSSISLKSKPSKTAYYVGDTLDTAGLALTVAYNNGSSEVISSGFTCTPTMLSTAGTQTITVKYYGKTVTFAVTVEEVKLSSISVKTKPSKTSYYEGDALNTSGLTLTATYNNGKAETIYSGFSCSPTTLSTSGTQKITVSYGGKTTSFNVSVTAVVVNGISIKSNPSKTSYYVGDKLDTSGLTLTATYNNGKTETIISGFSCSPTALNSAGTQKITVTYEGKTSSFNVTVTEVALKSIVVATMPSKTTYVYVAATGNYHNDYSLVTKGLTLTATYNNGSTETISDGFTCSPNTVDVTSPGQKTISVSYGNKTTAFQITVLKAVTGVELQSYPERTTYYVGGTFNSYGTKILVTYNDGSSETISSGFDCITDLSTVGTSDLTIQYQDPNTGLYWRKTYEDVITVKEDYIELSFYEYTCGSWGETISVKVTSNSGQGSSWTAETDAPWIIFHTTDSGSASGTGNGSLVVIHLRTYNNVDGHVPSGTVGRINFYCGTAVATLCVTVG